MTLGEWLDARVPAPPAELRQKLESELGGGLQSELGDAPAALLLAGKRLLKRVVDAGAQNRAHALDLLAADALVTYAFEAASELDLPLADLAADAMNDLTTLPTSH